MTSERPPVEYLGSSEDEDRPAFRLTPERAAFRPTPPRAGTPASASAATAARRLDTDYTSPSDARRILERNNFEGVNLDALEVGAVVPSNSRGNLEALQAIRIACQPFAIEHGLTIFVSNPHGFLSEPISYPGTLHIRFWSANGEHGQHEGRAMFYPSNTLGGLCNGGQVDGMAPTNQGIALRDQNGTIVAEIVNNTIFVLFDLPHCYEHTRCTRVQRSITQILELALPHLSLADEEELSGDELRSAFSEGVAKLTLTRPRAGTDDLARIAPNVADMARGLLQNVAQRRAALYEEWRQAEGLPNASTQFDTITAMPNVERIAVSATGIHILTRPITITHAGHVYAIGEFKISIGFTGEPVVMKNMTGTKDDYHHPHVSPSGRPSLANMASMIPELIAQGSIAEVVELLLEFLGHYNERNPYCRIEIWQ